MNTLNQDYLNQLRFTGAEMAWLGRIREFKGKEELYLRQTPEVLEALRNKAMIHSVESSNRIEGIEAPEKRIEALVRMTTEPKSRSEAEIAGYRNVLEMIHTRYEHIPLTPNVILQLHRDLMELATGTGGEWKCSDNEIVETTPDGQEIVHFVPLPTWKTPQAMDDLCRSLKKLQEIGQYDDLVLIAAFVMDFLSIHPFADGNGRMVRLLTLLLLYQSGFLAGRYISLEKVIEDTKEQYYDTLHRSSAGWHEGTHDFQPWWDYFLTMVLAAYSRFEERVGEIRTGRMGWKQKKVEQVALNMALNFTIADVIDRCLGISRPTITRTLQQLSQDGKIECIEHGRNARWRVVD